MPQLTRPSGKARTGGARRARETRRLRRRLSRLKRRYRPHSALRGLVSQIAVGALLGVGAASIGFAFFLSQG